MLLRIAGAAMLAGALLAGCSTAAAPPLPDGVGYPAIVPSVTLSALACEPLAWCIAAGSNPTASTHAASVEVTAGGRGHWAPVATPPITGATISSASCWAAGCLVGGADASGTLVLIVNPAHKAASTTRSHPPGTGITGIACTAPGRCLALVTGSTSTAVFATSDSGASWHQLGALPAALAVATAISCANAADCVAVGTGPGGVAVARSTDGGARWVLGAPPRGTVAMLSVTCGSARVCFATARHADGASALLESTNAGRSWIVAVTTVTSPGAVTCVLVPTCIVGGSNASGGAIATGVRTAHERLLALSYVPDPVVAVACATPVKCAAITPASTVSFVS